MSTAVYRAPTTAGASFSFIHASTSSSARSSPAEVDLEPRRESPPAARRDGDTPDFGKYIEEGAAGDLPSTTAKVKFSASQTRYWLEHGTTIMETIFKQKVQ